MSDWRVAAFAVVLACTIASLPSARPARATDVILPHSSTNLSPAYAAPDAAFLPIDSVSPMELGEVPAAVAASHLRSATPQHLAKDRTSVIPQSFSDARPSSTLQLNTNASLPSQAILAHSLSDRFVAAAFPGTGIIRIFPDPEPHIALLTPNFLPFRGSKNQTESQTEKHSPFDIQVERLRHFARVEPIRHILTPLQPNPAQNSSQSDETQPAPEELIAPLLLTSSGFWHQFPRDIRVALRKAVREAVDIADSSNFPASRLPARRPPRRSPSLSDTFAAGLPRSTQDSWFSLLHPIWQPFLGMGGPINSVSVFPQIGGTSKFKPN